VGCSGFEAWTLWLLGYPGQALHRSDSSVALAKKILHFHSLAYALTLNIGVHLFRRDRAAAKEVADELLTLTSDYGFSYYSTIATVLRCSAATLTATELRHMRGCLSAYDTTGAQLLRPYLRALLAEAAKQAGQPEEGLNALAEAMTVTDNTAERFYEAEQYRLKGELLLLGSPHSKLIEAQSCFQRAIEVARQQGARSLELRATTSLARLLALQGHREEARAMLSQIYNWFTEGFDTADLKDGKALLVELSE
jgi:predicted ATPase